jgi:hypothetical protein
VAMNPASMPIARHQSESTLSALRPGCALSTVGALRTAPNAQALNKIQL